MTGATLKSVVREVTGVTGVTGVTEVSGTMWMTEHERSDGWTDGQTIPDICHFFTLAKFLENIIYTEKSVDYDERISRQNSVNQDLLGQATKKSV